MLTLQQAIYQLQRKPSFVSVDSAVLKALVNESCEMLMVFAKAKDSLDRLHITAYGGILTLPRNYMTCEGVLRASFPLKIRSPWQEFSIAGPGSTLESSDPKLDGEIIDMGDGWCCFREPGDINAAGCQLKIYTDAANSTEVFESIMEFYGLDSAGNIIRTNLTSAPRTGEALDMTAAVGHATTASSFARITEVVKPLTNGVISVYAINPSDNSENLIALYDPSERSPNYRRYKVPPAPDGTNSYTITALCRRRYVEAIQENDILGIDHFAAILHGVLHITYRDANDDERAKRALDMAVDILSRQSVRSRPAGTYPPPIINMDELESQTSNPGY